PDARTGPARHRPALEMHRTAIARDTLRDLADKLYKMYFQTILRTAGTADVVILTTINWRNAVRSGRAVETGAPPRGRRSPPRGRRPSLPGRRPREPAD